MLEGDDGALRQAGQVVGGGDGGCRDAEKRHEHAVLAAHVLVGRVPQVAAVAQVAHGGAQLAAAEHRLGIAQAALPDKAERAPWSERIEDALERGDVAAAIALVREVQAVAPHTPVRRNFAFSTILRAMARSASRST